MHSLFFLSPRALDWVWKWILDHKLNKLRLGHLVFFSPTASSEKLCCKKRLNFHDFLCLVLSFRVFKVPYRLWFVLDFRVSSLVLGPCARSPKPTLTMILILLYYGMHRHSGILFPSQVWLTRDSSSCEMFPGSPHNVCLSFADWSVASSMRTILPVCALWKFDPRFELWQTVAVSFE